jgi:hypothetical protein
VPTDGGAGFCGNGEACDDAGACQPLTVNGMSGGAAGDCASGIGCSTNADCASGTCASDGGCL